MPIKKIKKNAESNRIENFLSHRKKYFQQPVKQINDFFKLMLNYNIAIDDQKLHLKAVKIFFKMKHTCVCACESLFACLFIYFCSRTYCAIPYAIHVS